MKENIMIQIDKDLKIQLKIIATKKETTMTKIITKLIEDYVEDNK